MKNIPALCIRSTPPVQTVCKLLHRTVYEMMNVPWYRFRQYLAVSLLFGAALSLLWGMWALLRQESLADEVIRLHVIAASDSAEDQRIKLRVRDAVLARASDWLEGTEDRETAEAILRAHLSDLQDAAQETLLSEGVDHTVTAVLAPEEYPTRDYGTFALPGGQYMSLRVIIGDGQGRNWWCVVFPPLCSAAVTEDMIDDARAAGLSDEDIALITRDSDEYVIQFKSIELWEALTSRWR